MTPLVTVHILRHGFALCGLPGLPGDWPKANVWVYMEEEEASKVNCVACAARALDIMAGRESPISAAPAPGGGKYETEGYALLNATEGDAALAIVLNGREGSGFSLAIRGKRVEASRVIAGVPALLRGIADLIDGTGRIVPDKESS